MVGSFINRGYAFVSSQALLPPPKNIFNVVVHQTEHLRNLYRAIEEGLMGKARATHAVRGHCGRDRDRVGARAAHRQQPALSAVHVAQKHAIQSA